MLAAYVNRLITLLSLLMEQILSAHLLEEKNPQDIYERWNLLRHDCNQLMNNSSLKDRVPDLKENVEAIADLEIFARNLYTNPSNTNLGAAILYRAESVHLSNDPEQARALMIETHTLIKEQLVLISQILLTEKKLNFECLQELNIVSKRPLRVLSIDEKQIRQLLDKALSILSNFIKPPEPGQYSAIHPQHYLIDAHRLLALLKLRLDLGIEGGNLRNYYKVLTTHLPLAIENLSIALLSLKGSLDLETLEHKNLNHNLVECCEKLGITNLSTETWKYLLSAFEFINLARYNELYKGVKKHKEGVKHLSRINQQISISLTEQLDIWTLQASERKELRREIAKIQQNTKIGLNHFISLAQLLKAFF